MDFGLSAREIHWRDRVRGFMAANIYPAVSTYQNQMGGKGASPWRPPPIIETLKARAFSDVLWNPVLPPCESDDVLGGEIWASGLTTLV
jgi:hypothetical protein